MAIITTAPIHVEKPDAKVSWVQRVFGPGWPLRLLLVGFPLWWIMGIASLGALILATIPMAVHILRSKRIVLPSGFGLWLLFIIWTVLGVFVLWADAPGTVQGGGGAGRLVGFGYRLMWYLAVTVALLYPLHLRRDQVSSLTIARWLGALFVYSVIGGLAGILAPTLSFPSLLELLIPGPSRPGFLTTMIHPALSTASQFLGYEQPRPQAPWVYANTWGNVVVVLLPFFVVGWWTSPKRWMRWSVPPVLVAFCAPAVMSLNRALWGALLLSALYALLLLAREGKTRLFAGAAVLGLAGAIAFAASPLWDTMALRIATPHSNARREGLTEIVVGTTLQGSPLIGFGTTRQVQGNFESISGGATPDCPRCAVPPLGTQGFAWRVVFTTGFVGAGLFFAFCAQQLLMHVRKSDPCIMAGCISLTAAVMLFFFYDSLEGPAILIATGIGIMNRERLAEIRPSLGMERRHGRRGAGRDRDLASTHGVPA